MFKLNKIHFYLFVISFIFILQINCKVKVRDEDFLFLNSNDTIKIPTSVNYNFSCEQFICSDTGMVFIGFSQPNIYMFNLSTKYNEIIKLKTDTLITIRKIISVHFHNRDSIFTIQQIPSKIYQFDDDGFLKAKWDIEDTLGNNIKRHFPQNTMLNKSPMNFCASLKTISYYCYFGKPLIAYSNPHEAVYSLLERRIIRLYGKYPDIYLNNAEKNKRFYQRDNFIRAFKDTITVFSFEASPFMDVYNNKSGKFIKKIDAKSKYINHPIETVKNNINELQSIRNYVVINPSYIKVLYDYNNKVFYRIVKHGQDLKNSNGRLNQLLDAEWSILLFDSSFNFIKEQKMKGGEYDFYKTYISDKGLMVKSIKDESETHLVYSNFAYKNEK